MIEELSKVMSMARLFGMVTCYREIYERSIVVIYQPLKYL